MTTETKAIKAVVEAARAWEAYYDGESHKVVDADGALIGKFLDAKDATLAASAPTLRAALAYALAGRPCWKARAKAALHLANHDRKSA